MLLMPGYWAGGRIRAAATFGFRAAVLAALYVFALGAGWLTIVIVASLFGAVVGGFVAQLRERQWWGYWEIAPADRVTIVRAVKHGTDVGNRRLTPDTLDLAEQVSRPSRSPISHRVIDAILGACATFALVIAAVDGRDRAVVWWAAFVIYSVVQIARGDRRRTNAARAATFAEHRLAEPTAS